MNALTDKAEAGHTGTTPGPLAAVRAEMQRMAPEIARALPPHISAERFQRVVLTAIQSNPDLLEADRRSLWAACVKAAQDGLLPDGREGALITFYDRRRGRLVAQWMPMVAGILKKVRNSGELASITANVVYEGEHFRVVLGDEERIEHERDLDAVGRRDPVAVYAIATLRNGERVREVMTWQQVEDVRAISRAPENGPWGQWTEEMARKTVIRRLAKRLPMSSDKEQDEELRRVIERIDEQYEFARDRKRPEEAELEHRVADRISDGAAPANDDADGTAQPEPVPAIAYVAANGKVHVSPDVASWRADWLKRVKALVLAGRQAELQEAWERNSDAIAAVAQVAPLTADEVVQAIRDALGFGADLPEPEPEPEPAAEMTAEGPELG
ncbi:MAG: recombinase RecT [Acetobacteraceae bacterium]|nr:recombinase RecT [Acetobacteraceae bacterium]